METIIITRHKSLVEYMKEINLVTGDENIITDNATLSDVSGKHVIGVLPNFLAAHAAFLTEIPLKIPADLRGKELSLEQVRAFAGQPVTYRISVVDTPKLSPGNIKWQWNDKMGSRARRQRCLVIAPNGSVYRFSGKDIPGVVKVLGSHYEKCGKWSNSTYRCLSPGGTIPIQWQQDWDTGETFPMDTWGEAYAWVLEKAPHANEKSFIEMVRAEFKEAAEKFGENEAAIKFMEGSND